MMAGDSAVSGKLIEHPASWAILAWKEKPHEQTQGALRAVFGGPAPVPAAASQTIPVGMPPRSSSGAIQAIGLSLNKLVREADEARRLRESFDGSERVIELDPGLIQSSITADRPSEKLVNDAAFAALKASMAENGQQLPILVRPHPDEQKSAEGWYQVAYGHRRIRAARELGLQVKAIVQTLDDQSLIAAQGNENADRRDLFYIERALFAQSMIAKGFDRPTAQSALSVDKTELSRMLQVAGSVPEYVARAIGPAPKVGRLRWQTLSGLLASEAWLVKVQDEIYSEHFHGTDSDRRFQLLYDRLTRKERSTTKSGGTLIKDGEGRVLARLSSSATKTRTEIDGAGHKAFAVFIAQELPASRRSLPSGAGGWQYLG